MNPCFKSLEQGFPCAGEPILKHAPSPSADFLKWCSPSPVALLCFVKVLKNTFVHFLPISSRYWFWLYLQGLCTRRDSIRSMVCYSMLFLFVQGLCTTTTQLTKTKSEKKLGARL